MRTVALAAVTGILMTGLTVLLVSSLRGHREPEPTRIPVSREPVVVAPPPEEPERSPSSALAPVATTRPTELLEPAPMVESVDLPALADAHPGASLTRTFPRLDTQELRRALGRGEASESADRPARPVSRPAPRYPSAARRNRTEGFVRVRLRVDPDGRVEDVVVVESEPPGVFDRVALEAARRYRFEPATRNGQAVESTLEQRIVFRLQQ